MTAPTKQPTLEELYTLRRQLIEEAEAAETTDERDEVRLRIANVSYLIDEKVQEAMEGSKLI